MLQSATRDQRQARGGAMRGNQGFSSRNPPFREGQRELDFLGSLAAEGLDPGKTRAAQTGHIDGRHAGGSELSSGLFRYAAADFLDDHRNRQVAAERADFLYQAAEVVIAFRLQRLLERV